MGFTLRAGVLVGLVGLAILIAVRSPLGGDYPGPACTGCDYAGPSISALVHGDAEGFFRDQPFMGSLSLLVRAPFAALAQPGSNTVLWQYRLGLIPCLLALIALAVLLEAIMRQKGQPLLVRVAVVGLCTASPMTFRAIAWGHPEELLGGALCVAAIVAAAQRRTLAAGVLLGLALATKQWALLAIAPTVLAAAEGRVRILLLAAGVAGALTLPMLLGDAGAFISQNHAAGIAWGGLTPTNLWWAFGHQTGISIDSAGSGGTYALSRSLANLSHPLVIGVAAVLSAAYWRRRPRHRPYDVLLLLAFIFLVRCLLDPFTISYHHAPFLLALAGYEAVSRRGLPFLTIYAAAGLWAISAVVAPLGDPDSLYRAYVAWALPLAAYMGLSLYLPARASAWDAPLRLPRPIASLGE